jgi:hypothetical protein
LLLAGALTQNPAGLCRTRCGKHFGFGDAQMVRLGLDDLVQALDHFVRTLDPELGVCLELVSRKVHLRVAKLTSR